MWYYINTKCLVRNSIQRNDSSHRKFLKNILLFFALQSIYIKRSAMTYIQLSTLEKGGRFLNKKNLTTSIRYVIQVERDGSFISSTSSQRCQSSVRSLLLHQGGAGFVLRTRFSLQQREAQRIKSRFQNYVRPFRTAGPGDGLASSLHPRDASIDGASTRCFLSPLTASPSHDRLAMLARKR